ncbi:outer membrane homotrimeric porin [Desulfohalobium retbaense]|uniref:Outer membrane porin n=1 Tax=Desulfohalobium retbaense (strain ATCC 49708 / DSM 5692 / JCM 16813 / HR100) TaxID=485915 RepID=C8X420_DESRD|nr:outer membrane homotrimeric porin [Desulfohalobium retbaense]ACV69167.1 conserved hypothetical protein [Desulfohalobium retbaense DSM 5692]
MKRIALLALVAVFVLGMAGSASALHLQQGEAGEAGGGTAYMNIYGHVANYAYWENNTDFNDNEYDSADFFGETDWYLGFEIAQSENLKAFIQLYQEQDWGVGPGEAGEDSTENLKIEHAYLDFMVPNTDIRVKGGDFGFQLPGAGGDNVFDDTANGIQVSMPFNDMVGLTAGYAMLDQQGSAWNATDAGDDNEFTAQTSAVYAVLPITMDGVAFNPYFMFAESDIGEESGSLVPFYDEDGSPFGEIDDHTAYWYGFNGQVTMFDPITIGADFIYGTSSVETKDNFTVEGEDAEDAAERAGWFTQITADYKMDMFTPGVVFFYGSGDDDDPSDGSEMLPTVVSNYKPFNAVDDFGNGYVTNADGDTQAEVGAGLWALAFQLKDISFIEKLSHDLTIGYVAGTSDKEAADFYGDSFMTEEDSMWTVEFDNSYQVYENLSAGLFFAYTKADYDEDLGDRGDDFADDAYTTMEASLSYSF